MSKRKRTGDSQLQAAAIGASLAEKWPYSKYGRAYLLRGTDANLSRFGASFATATPEQRSMRREYGYTGRGKYSLTKAWKQSGLGKTAAKAGRQLIKAGADRAAKYIGGGMYTGYGMYTGHGKYLQHRNSTIKGGDLRGVAYMRSSGDEEGSVVVSRREFISDIFSPPKDSFEVQKFYLNPGLESTFPWLSQIAQNYDEYELKQCVFEYVSQTTDIGSSTTGQCGSVTMATNYNPAVGAFQSKQDMLASNGAQTFKTTESGAHGVECDPSKLSGTPGKYIRANPVVSGQDLKSFDHALFQLVIVNAPDAFENQVVGGLWVYYTVVLRKPKFFVSKGLGISQDLFCWTGSNDGHAPWGQSANTAATGYPASALDLTDGTGVWLKGVQNNIGCLCRVFNSGGTSMPIGLAIVFPAYYSGHLEIHVRLRAKSGQAQFNTANNKAPLDLIGLSGNVSYVNDMYAADNTGNAIASYHVTDNHETMQIVHLYVRAASSGIDNALIAVSTVHEGHTSLQYQQGALEIREYNAGFSYRHSNINSSDAPIMINNSGVQVSPTPNL